MRSGVVGELYTAEALIAALRELKRIGYRDLDAFTPYPVPEVEELLDLPRSRLTWLVGITGFGAAAVAYLIQWLCNAYSYPIDVGGRPPHAVPTFLIDTYASGILVAMTVAFLALLVASGLPRLHQPIFQAEAFERVAVDRYFVGVLASDPLLGPRTFGDLEQAGAVRVSQIGDPE